MMPFEPGRLGELASFAAALYCGILIGMLYDVFCILRMPFKSPWIMGIFDLLYYTAAVCVAAAAMLYINCGTFRLYIYIAIGLGILLYKRYPGRLIKLGMGKFTKKQLHRKP